ncbi:MAG: hypothetical protein JSU01_01130 [Bacteroidetes bacterium]|nr:hypothetical protein [Bacteroidota bacterium]
MSKIGIVELDVHYFLDKTDNLKREVLLFDDLIITGVTSQKEELCKVLTGSSRVFSEKKGELENFIKFGLIKEQIENRLQEVINDNIQIKMASLQKRIEYNIKAVEAWEQWQKRKDSGDLDFQKVFIDFLETDSKSSQFRTRSFAVEENQKFTQDEYVPLIRRELYHSPPIGFDMKTKVINVSITKLPMIDDSISLDQLSELKSDDDFKLKFFAFRDFVNSLCTTTLTISEVDEKIDYLLMDYEKQLKMHKAKYQLSRLETIFVTSAEIFENLAKMKFGKIAKSIISLRNKEIELLEEERKITGREVAVLYDIKNLNN